jgi:ribosomal-protein-alanine N-acetyltransferase
MLNLNTVARQLPVLTTERLTLRLAAVRDAPAVLRFYAENREHLTPWWPEWREEQFTLHFWQRAIENNLQEFREERSVRFFLFPRNEPQRVIGLANYNQIVRGVAHYAILGYGISAEHEGKGLMSEALRETIRYMFEDFRLHRIMANYVPRNTRSGALLNRLGFTVEGAAKDYLLINGRWEDHVLTSLINREWVSGK